MGNRDAANVRSLWEWGGVREFLIGNAVLAGVYFALAKVGLSFALVNGSVTLVWPPAGVALAAVVVWGARMLPGVAVGVFASNFAWGESWLFPLASMLGNTGEALVGAVLLLWLLRFRCQMDRVRDILGLQFSAGGGAVVAATVGVSALWATGSVANAVYFRTWFHWWMGDVIGMVVVAPVVFVLTAYGAPKGLSWLRALEGAALMMAGFFGGLVLFGVAFPTWPALSILVIPVLMLVAFRFALREVAFANLLVAAGAAIGAARTFGGSHPDILARGLLTLSILLLVSGLTAQLLAAIRAQWKCTERALRENEQKYRELVENANSIILRWDSEGRITFLNEYGLAFFGYSAEEIIGHHVIGTITPPTESSGRDLQRLMDQICADPKAFEQNVNENMRRNGERVWVSWTNKIKQDEQGKVTEILSVGTDVTARKRAEESLRELNATLERRVAERTAELALAKERAESADRIKSAFLAAMSHELRTPLNSIIGFTGIVLQGLPGPLNPEQTKQLGMVQGSARHLLDLINDVLDLSKIEAGQLEVEAKPFDARESVEKVMRLVAPLAEKKGLALSSEISPDVGGLTSDRRRFEQILINLINNGLKFTEKGHVRIECAMDGQELVTRVVDTGIGIKPEDMGKLFQAFRQVDVGLTRNHEGTGLGLSICKRLVEKLGGRIWVESEWGVGSVFAFTISTGRG